MTDGAQARRTEHRDNRLRRVGKVRGDAIASLHPVCLQRGGNLRRRRHQLRLREACLQFIFAAKHQSVAGIVGTAPRQQILGEVEARVGKPRCTRHAMRFNERSFSPRADDPRIVPELAPERLALVVGPAPKRRVVIERSAGRCRDPSGKVGDVRPRDAFGRRLPEQCVGGHLVER